MKNDDVPQGSIEAPEDFFSIAWRRLKDHRIAQWAVGYVAVAYGIQHGFTLTAEAYDWPHAVLRISMTLLALGLPLAMIVAWYHGERIPRRISAGEATLASLLLVLISLVFYIFVRGPEQKTSTPAQGVNVSAAQPAALVAPVPPNAKSIAVLPFANVSDDPKEEYFSDGMTDEIMSALANVGSLWVIGRQSAFEFKGKNQDNRAIGRALGARYLVEGSVRKVGDHIRITAQLVRAENGVSLWTENYDRGLKDVFAVQEDVARAIAAALQVPLGLKAGENLVSNRTSDTGAYEDYLRALALFRAGDFKQVTAVLEPMANRDPTYAPAWALLALSYEFEPLYVAWQSAPLDEIRKSLQSALAKADMAAREAIRLDPRYALGYTAIGDLEALRGHLAAADGDFEKALALDPADPDTLTLYAGLLLNEGRLRQSLKVDMTLRRFEPLVPVYNLNTAVTMLLSGDANGAIPILEPLPPDGQLGAFRNDSLAFAYASLGQYQRASETILAIPQNQVLYSAAEVGQAATIIREAPAKSISVSTEPVTPSYRSELVWVYAFVNPPERFLDALEYQAKTGTLFFPVWPDIWHPALAAARKTQQFKQLVREGGLVDYWRAKGWPDVCRAVGSDFECK